MRKNRFEIMFGKCFFVFCFQKLVIKNKIKKQFFVFFY